jgi:hypothetical protein
MTRLVWALAAAILAAPVSIARGAPGDGIAQACVQAYEALFKEAGSDSPDRRYANREALCGCLQERVTTDARLSAVDKDKVREVFVALATDREKAAELADSMSKESGKLLDDHDGHCAAQHAK